jgi:ketosteroid isomerase-like protein
MKAAVASFLLLAAPPLALALPEDLAQALNEYYQAEMSNDIDALNRLLADDYMVVNSDASVEDKQKTLANFATPGFKVDPYVFEERVERVWENAAIISGRVRLGWTQGGRHQTRLLHMTYVWAKRDGRWQATFTQVTRVPSPE